MTVQIEFDHDVQDVFEALTDPEFLVKRNLALGELSAQCDVKKGQKQTTITMVREVRRVLPGVLAKMFDPVNVMDMTEIWRPVGQGWSGNWDLDIQDQPVSISGSFELLPTARGCRYSVTHLAKVEIPFLRGQIEKFILGQTTSGADNELTYLGNYLDQDQDQDRD